MRLISRGVAAVGFAASCALFIAALVIAGFGAFSSGSDNVDAAAPLATVGEEKPSPTAVAIPAETVPGVPTLGDDDQDEGSAEGDPTLDGLPAEPPEQGLSNDVRPVRVKIPAIDVDANVIDLGLNPDRTLEVPTDYAETGWYTGRSVPGAVGPSVVVGHLDSFSGPAVFYRLQDLVPGHIVEIHRSDDVVARFRVTGTKLVDKDEFPTAEVYGPTEAPTLRLITCDGAFDESARSYEGNLLVFAEHIENINAWKPSRLTGRR
jgi:LPXTG-site transpeptidase (sortase) family protein